MILSVYCYYYVYLWGRERLLWEPFVYYDSYTKLRVYVRPAVRSHIRLLLTRIYGCCDGRDDEYVGHKHMHTRSSHAT